MQVMVTENRYRGISEAAQITQRLKRAGTPVDEVPYKPQRVVRRIEADAIEEPLQLVVAALDVADSVGGYLDSPTMKSTAAFT